MITKGLVRNLFRLVVRLAVLPLFTLNGWALAPAPAQSSAPKTSKSATASRTKTATKPTPAAATAALHNLFDAEWEYSMQQNPTFASFLGDRRFNDKWDDVSLA